MINRPELEMQNVKTSIYETLDRLNLTSYETREIFSVGTRDNKEITVWRDKLSGVIYIDNFFIGDDEYENGLYRSQAAASVLSGSLEDFRDTARRFENYRQFYHGLEICDFGCGEGSFVQQIKSSTSRVIAIELQKSCLENLESKGIECYSNIEVVPDNTFDTIFSFHVLEHLSNPLEVLEIMKRKLKPGGTMVLEVPSANDFLLMDQLGLECFKQFTLWSQHLILHNRLSIERFVKEVGLTLLCVEGVQRYPLSNHLNWLRNKKPGGHKSFLSVLDSPLLTEAYEASLRKIDATDTLTAIITKN